MGQVDAYSGKCEFCLSRLTFFGHKLTSYGVNPSKRLQLSKKREFQRTSVGTGRLWD